MLKIKTTGLEQYMPGGEAHIKTMVIGGPGVGKTRWASYWPTPFYLNCEEGLASVADRKVPYVDIGGSQDMLDALKWLKQHPDAKKFGTVVVDTLDSFQRKVKDEWLQANAQAEAFSGYDAWGYLDAKMQMLMTRLLSLDKNVIVLVHYKEKTVSEKVGSNTVDKQVFQLQLQGDIKDTAFNDFDLVGWMDTYFEHDGEGDERKRVQKRGITFNPTYQRPYLKDRLHIIPSWLPVEFAESDYVNLFTKFMARIDELEESGEIGEVVEVDEPEIEADGVRQPMRGGPVAPQDPREMPLEKLTAAELKGIAKKEGIKLKSGLLKAQIVSVIKESRKAMEGQAEQDNQPAKPVTDAETAAKPEASESSGDEATSEQPESASDNSTPVEDGEVADEGAESLKAQIPNYAPEQEDDAGGDEEASNDPAPPTDEEADQNIKEGLGGERIDGNEPVDDETPAPEPEPAKPEPAEDACEECGKDLKGESADLVKLAYIKFRKSLCNEDYRKAKAATR